MAALKNFLSLIILFIVICVLAGIAFVVYTIVNDVTDKTKRKMEKKNISFGKDGMKVSVKERTAEQESDSAQGLLVKAWNAASIPEAKSQLGLGHTSKSPSSSAASTPAATPGLGTEKRRPFSRSPSGRPKA